MLGDKLTVEEYTNADRATSLAILKTRGLMTEAKRVFVTGVSGFIGSHVARVALLSGLAVRGTVRDVEWTKAVHKAIPGTEVITVDLLSCSEEELATAMAGCAYLAHVASPFPGGDVSDDEMKTAIEGTAKVPLACPLVLVGSSVEPLGKPM